MSRFPVLAAFAALAALHVSIAALAQGGHSHQPYAELKHRPVKALSDEQIGDLRAGRGMGLALAAELNGYPGPRHVLEHADELNLGRAERERTQALFEAMLAETIPLGEQLIRQETDLDRLFASKAITPESLAGATSTIGETLGALRAAHLRYHLIMMDVLTPEQVRRYNELRGYGADRTSPHSRGIRGHDRGH
jgi:Spy/CpxP family protein refolding chaperone